jgi:glycerol-3-phosphate dehydrogenase
MYDIIIIGGGINGVGIARDAAGRGLKVMLCEKDDLASHTSSASSKLIHGGLRYLENYEFRLVRESLCERETLLRAAPHIIWPIRIVLPVEPGMRPAWMLRAGLFIYDHLTRRTILPPTKSLNLRKTLQGQGLQDHLKKGFEYSDCWADDARLVALNALDAAERGADIRTRTECTALNRHSDHWTVMMRDENGIESQADTKLIVNAAGPWVERVLGKFGHLNNSSGVRLVKGSHIVTRQLYDGDHSYIFQNADDRIIFAMPYEDDFTLIGTTDVPWEFGQDQGKVEISPEETDYLCSAVNEYFTEQITPDDVCWAYAGVRPLFDDKQESASVVTRDYVFNLDGGNADHGAAGQAPALSIFGGKLTTYRRLAEHAMEKLQPFFANMKPAWTHEAPLPGGDFASDGVPALKAQYASQYPWLDRQVMDRIVGAYGTRAGAVLNGATQISDLGHHYGAGLYQAEVDYLHQHEFARKADDILWRRSKIGLHMTGDQRAAFSRDVRFSAVATADVSQ